MHKLIDTIMTFVRFMLASIPISAQSIAFCGDIVESEVSVSEGN